MNTYANKPKAFAEGLRDGLPIGLGYLAVSFSLGIAARNAGLNPFQGFLASLLTIASAGEYAAFAVIAASGTYIEMALTILVTNLRYLLMSCALSQKFDPGAKLGHRMLVGFGITDEIFGAAIARPGKLEPLHSYGCMTASVPCWAVGTMLGIIAGNILPLRIVSALSVALYGMFLAVVIPPARHSRPILLIVLVSFGLSLLASIAPVIKNWSGGMQTVVLTLLIASAFAIICPVKQEESADEE